MGLECPTLLHHAVILGLIALLCHETLEQDHCVCTEKSPPSSIDLSVSQQTTTITTNVIRRTQFNCNVSIMSRSTDHPLVYWYKDCPNSVGGKTVFSGKSPSGEYINRVNQTVHETQEHENLRTRRFTLEILHPNVNDSGDYFCVTIIRTKDGSFGSCGGGTKLEVVDEFIKETTTISNSNIEEKASTFKLVSPLMVLTGFLLSLAGVIALISLFRGLFLIIRKWKIDPYHKNKAGVNTAHVFPATQLCIEEGIYSDVDMRPRMTR
uniref:Ancestral antigen receptor A3 n=1 Tax=Eptatretus burgeri TaxID=7764 RepID=Q5DWN9_EPTBU|nr:ancestral antigen receptor A3 [Eptatretus burgeri]